MSSRLIPALICGPTKGRKVSSANHVHAPQGSMSGGHGIMSADMIPAPVRRPTKEDIYHGEPCASAGGSMSERHGIMSADMIPSPFLRSDSPTGRKVHLYNAGR